MLAATGQLTPCIGRRINDDRVLLYAGQRRLLAARASHELAGTPEFQALAPVTSVIVLLLDHEPSNDEIRRIQARENHGRICRSRISSGSSPTVGRPVPGC